MEVGVEEGGEGGEEGGRAAKSGWVGEGLFVSMPMSIPMPPTPRKGAGGREWLTGYFSFRPGEYFRVEGGEEGGREGGLGKGSRMGLMKKDFGQASKQARQE